MCKCSECNNKFDIPYARDWVYKVKNAQCYYIYQCSYTCWRKACKDRFKRCEQTIKDNLAEEEFEDLWMR